MIDITVIFLNIPYKCEIHKTIILYNNTYMQISIFAVQFNVKTYNYNNGLISGSNNFTLIKALMDFIGFVRLVD